MINFTCTFASTIYFITYTYCKKLYISETGRRLGDRFRAHDVEENDKDISKPVAKHLISLIVPCSIWMAVFGLSLHLSSSGSRKAREQNFLSQDPCLVRKWKHAQFYFISFDEIQLFYQNASQPRQNHCLSSFFQSSI